MEKDEEGKKDSFAVMKMEGIIGENNKRRIPCSVRSSPSPRHRLNSAKTSGRVNQKERLRAKKIQKLDEK